MKSRIPVPALCLVTDRRLWPQGPQGLEEAVSGAVRGGVDLVQLREKDLPGGQLLELAERLRRVTKGSALLFVNGRVDVALACGADGVQLGEDAIPVEAARRVAGERLILGRSVHSLKGALEAEEAGADFLIVGTVFPTGSHPDDDAAGPQLLSEIAGMVGIRFLGIGGIHAGNLRRVMSAGASGAAVISAILSAPDPREAAAQLKAAMKEAWTELGTGTASVTGTR